MIVLRWLSLFLFIVIMTVFFQGYRSWELGASAAVLTLILFWTCGAFSREIWVGSRSLDAERARVDAELDDLDRTYP